MPRFVTRRQIVMEFGGGQIKHPITVPAGTRVVACDDLMGPEEFFVDDLAWLDPSDIVYHDAVHHGIRIPANEVEEA